MQVPEIKFYSEETGLFYKLVPTKTWPTLQISGIHMHRIKDVDPKKDTELKLKSLGKLFGNVLDICTGLGYTAILAARSNAVEKVITIEKDPNVIAIAKQNPFSKELFTNPKIKLIIADAYEKIKEFESERFNFIIHDPPRYALASGLYSLSFYKELFRVLKHGGKMFHYTGMPGSKQGKNYLKGILRRLREAGFVEIKKASKACGVVVRKS